MTDLRKAAEMALEALEHAQDCVRTNYHPGHYWEKEIEALRQALEEPANSTTDFVEPKTASQPEQEGMKIDASAPLVVHPHPAFAAPPKREWVATIGNWGKVEWREDVFPQLGAKLYSAPPKREWVGLTRRELDIATLGLEDLSDCYKAIEAKLKEKNGG